jgi:hypothetical protein
MSRATRTILSSVVAPTSGCGPVDFDLMFFAVVDMSPALLVLLSTRRTW